MTKRVYILLFFSLFTISATAQNIVGSWSGPIKLPQGDLPFVLHISGTEGDYEATADSPDQNSYGMPVDTVMVNGTVFRFAIGQLKVKYEGTFMQTDSIAGDFVQNGATFPLGFRRVGSKPENEDVQVSEENIVRDTVAVDAERDELPVEEEIVQEEAKEEAGQESSGSLTTNADSTISVKIKSLEPVLEQVLQNYQVAGYAVAVVNKDGIVYSKGFGLRDVENEKPVTPHTLFAIGSSTKAFTAALVGQLADQGKVSLDSPVVHYLPKMRFYTDELTNRITLRDMMSHRTGLPRYDFSWYLFPTSSRDSLLDRIKYMHPSAGIREKWQYNNFMYLAQGMLVEEFSGKSWEKNMKDVFFNPLGMPRSNTSISAMQQDEDASLGYTLVQDSVLKRLDYYNINAMGPAGSINSSVDELSNWVKLWLNGGDWEGKEILSKNYISDAVSSQMVMSGGKPTMEHPDISFSNYGLGWMLHSYRGHFLVEHGGNIDGFSASVSFFPYDGLGIIVLSNQNGSAVPHVVRNTIADKVFDLPYYAWSKVNKGTEEDKDEVQVKDMGRVMGTQTSHALKEYEGAAVHPAFGRVDFYVKNDSLFAKFPERSFWLKHYHYDVFEAKAMDTKTGVVDTLAATTKFNFQTSVDGAIASVAVAFEPSFKEAQVFEISRSVDVSTDELQKYVGVYELSGMEVNVYRKGEDLYVSVPGQPDYKSIAQGGHKFKPEALSGYTFAFEADPEGDITALYFVQPNGTFKATRK